MQPSRPIQFSPVYYSIPQRVVVTHPNTPVFIHPFFPTPYPTQQFSNRTIAYPVSSPAIPHSISRSIGSEVPQNNVKSEPLMPPSDKAPELDSKTKEFLDDFKFELIHLIPSNLATPSQCAKMPFETVLDLFRISLIEKQMKLLSELAKLKE